MRTQKSGRFLGQDLHLHLYVILFLSHLPMTCKMIKLLVCDSILTHLEQRLHNIQKSKRFFGGCKDDDFQHKILVAVCNVCVFNLFAGLTNIVRNICSFCANLRYMLNLSVQRVCLEEDIFNNFNSCVNSFDFVDLKTYLKKILSDTFFVYNHNEKLCRIVYRIIKNYIKLYITENPDFVLLKFFTPPFRDVSFTYWNKGMTIKELRFVFSQKCVDFKKNGRPSLRMYCLYTI